MDVFQPASETVAGVPGFVLAWVVFLLGVGLFAWVIHRRLVLLRQGQADPRLGEIGRRILDLITYGFIQKRQPRYFWAGVLHLMIFWGFVVLALRSLDLVTQGLGLPVLRPLLSGGFGAFYGTLKDTFALIVLVACLVSILRRAVGRPARYQGSHAFEGYLVLALIAFLMITDMVFEAAGIRLGEEPRFTLPAAALVVRLLPDGPESLLAALQSSAYWLHYATLFFFLVFLPLGKHFHIITALPNVFLRKRTRGALKPPRWGVENLEDLEALGVKSLGDFTWKHLLDLFTCTECGRCSDHCPANAVGRPLSPKMITIKLRDLGYRQVPVFAGRGQPAVPGGEGNGAASPASAADRESPMVGGLIAADEIWSCTTCGACEQECPVFIEYVDKIVDMRRHLIENAEGPTVFNNVLMNLEKTGNPFGKPPAKRTEWLDDLAGEPVRILKEGDEADVLFFVDSYGSFDPAARTVARAVVQGLQRAGVDFGILGPREKDSGHQPRRIGEEGLFQFLMEENVETIGSVRVQRIVTTDPHAFNTLGNEYPGDVPVDHYTTFFAELLEAGRLVPRRPVEGGGRYTYHDPCYLGRHNGVYDAPRRLLDAIPGVERVEMARSRDRSFCCGGGDVALWHEIEQEDERMADRRVRMARDAGANVLVTACPFCFIHFEDAIKTGGLENEIRVVDLMDLFVNSLQEA